VSANWQSFLRDERGSVILEMTVTVAVFFLVLFGIVEFSYLFYQWNTATKAVQHGARLAAVSNPVSSDLTNWTGLNLTGSCAGLLPGDPIPQACKFDRVCTSNSSTGATGSCTNGGTYDAAAMQTIVFGRGKTACAAATSSRDVGMCNIYDKIGPQNAVVRYEYTGLGYAGRPCGPVPTITVSLTGINFNFVILNGLVSGLPSSVSIPGLNTTITGEDLNLSASAACG
jgi:hypothetical protein